MTDISDPIINRAAVAYIEAKNISQKRTKLYGRSSFKTFFEKTRNIDQFSAENRIRRSPMVPDDPEEEVVLTEPRRRTTITPAADRKSPIKPRRDIFSLRKIHPNRATKAGEHIMIQFAVEALAVFIAKLCSPRTRKIPWKLIIKRGSSSRFVGKRNVFWIYEPAKRKGMDIVSLIHSTIIGWACSKATFIPAKLALHIVMAASIIKKSVNFGILTLETSFSGIKVSLLSIAVFKE